MPDWYHQAERSNFPLIAGLSLVGRLRNVANAHNFSDVVYDEVWLPVIFIHELNVHAPKTLWHFINILPGPDPASQN